MWLKYNIPLKEEVGEKCFLRLQAHTNVLCLLHFKQAESL